MGIRKPTLLVIDDSPVEIQLIIENLKHNYAIQVATSGEKALQKLGSDLIPDLILLDVHMPGLDGYDTCRRIKSNPTTQDIDVIFVSAHDTTEEKMAGYDACASDYVIKPV